ncbi:hypothetical protein GGR52DRAFT_575776 [Hypoxylon sp. FL1284]|nr:hypothetical protein GGR52DRAFT_575776 [Hypoxylon sp. FL1284]
MPTSPRDTAEPVDSPTPSEAVATTTSDSACPYARLNLDVLAHILSHVDSIRELVPVLLSHRSFYEAFKGRRNTIYHGVITREIPARVLPFVVAQLESDGRPPPPPPLCKGTGMKADIRASLYMHVHGWPLRCGRLSAADYLFLSATYAAVRAAPAALHHHHHHVFDFALLELRVLDRCVAVLRERLEAAILARYRLRPNAAGSRPSSARAICP